MFTRWVCYRVFFSLSGAIYCAREAAPVAEMPDVVSCCAFIPPALLARVPGGRDPRGQLPCRHVSPAQLKK